MSVDLVQSPIDELPSRTSLDRTPMDDQHARPSHREYMGVSGGQRDTEPRHRVAAGSSNGHDERTVATATEDGSGEGSERRLRDHTSHS